MALNVDGKDLYAVAIERLGPDGQPAQGKIFHIHASDAAEARLHYLAAFPNRRTHRVIGAAPCIGLFVNDKKGEDISAT
jgi:hypothetical protein